MSDKRPGDGTQLCQGHSKKGLCIGNVELLMPGCVVV